MLWWGAALALIGGLVTLGASVWLTVEVGKDHRRLQGYRREWDRIRARISAEQAEMEERFGTEMLTHISLREDGHPSFQEEPPAGALDIWSRIKVLEREARLTGESRTWADFEGEGKRDIERAQAKSAWKIQTRQGAVAAFGGFVAVVGALLTFLGS